MRGSATIVLGLIATLAVATSPARAQTGTIAGRVIDRETRQPMAGVQVYLDGTAYGGLTDEAGRYVLSSVPLGTYTVVTQMLGYANGRAENVVVRADEPASADFELSITVLKLEEVVATGTVDPIAGVKVPFTVGKVTKQDMPVPATRAAASLQGRVAGVRVTRQNGQPGGGVDVLLRGATSIITNGRDGVNEPLYVVDGVILAQGLQDIDASDIENIEVLKGAAAASLYGSRASAGVIQITTSRGRDLAEGSTRFLVRSEYGFNRVNVDRDYITRHHHYLVDPAAGYVDEDGNPVDKEGRVADPDFMADNEYPGQTYDHIDQFFNAGAYLRNSFSIAHNSRDTNFMVSFNTQNDKGVVNGLCDAELFDPLPVPDGCGNDGAWLYGLRANVDHRVRDDLNLAVSTYYSRSRQEDWGGGNIFYNIMFMPPDVDLREKNEDGEPFLVQPDAFTLQANPLYAIAYATNEDVRSRFSGSLTARYSPANWFSLEANASFDRSDRHENNFTPIGFKNLTTVSTGQVVRNNDLTQALNANLTASFLRSFGDLTTRTKLQYLLERENNDDREAEGESLTVRGVPSIDVAASPDAGSEFEEIRSTGYSAITGLDYRGKYIAEAMIRRDGSSLFGPDERWHNYYRASGAWRVSEEPWWFIPALDEFKLRYSFGTAGGRPGFNYRYEVWNVGGAGNISKGTLGNSALKPEHQTEQEFGIDMILNNRYSLQLVYARSKIEDQLLQIPLPGVFGYSNQWQNAGTLESNTFEVTLEAQLINRPDFRWSVNLVADRTRSEITEFERSCFGNNPHYCAGTRIGTIRGVKWLTAKDQLAHLHPSALDQFVVNDDGLLVWVGSGTTYTDGLANGLWGTTGEVDGATYDWGLPIWEVDADGLRATVPIADANPEANFGLGSSIQWKGLTLYALFDAKVGGDIYSETRQWSYRDNTHADYDQAGKPDDLKKPVTYYQRLYLANSDNSWFVEEGTYLKLRDVVLQYTFDRDLLQRLLGVGIEQLTLGVTGRNLFTLTDYSGFDPEVGNIRTARDDFDYPNFRTFTIKADVQF
ncbi:MAG: SusC/RagA family TonB-linked outer membrane protein [Longimicrobiales bacterium]